LNRDHRIIMLPLQDYRHFSSTYITQGTVYFALLAEDRETCITELGYVC
jgi:hypothetical protein